MNQLVGESVNQWGGESVGRFVGDSVNQFYGKSVFLLCWLVNIDFGVILGIF